MNITKENLTDLNAEIKVQITKEDYEEKVNNILKDYRKKAAMPGFRPGKVPMGLVKKMYGNAVFIDEINKIIQDGLFKYIADNKLSVIGSPLPNTEKSYKIGGIDDQDNFELIYDIGLEPEFEVGLSDKIKANYYSIKVDDAEVDRLLEEMRKRYGNYTNPEDSAEGDLLYGNIEELDEEGNTKEDGIKAQTTIAVDFITHKNIKKSFIGKKKEDKIVFDPVKATGNETEVASMLKINKDQVKELKNKFSFTIEGISRVEPAELNQEFFDKVYMNQEIKDIEQLKDKIREDASKSYSTECDRFFINEVMDTLLEKLQLPLPDDFLKRWMIETDEEGKLTAEEVEKNYSMYADSLRYQLIQSKIQKENDLKVEEKDIDAYLGEFIEKQFAHILEGKESKDETLKSIIQNIKQNKEEMNRVYGTLLNQKLNDLFKEKIKVKDSEVTYEEFIKLASKKDK